MAYTVNYRKETDGSTTKIETITTPNCDTQSEIKTIEDEITRSTTYITALSVKKQTITDATRSIY